MQQHSVIIAEEFMNELIPEPMSGCWLWPIGKSYGIVARKKFYNNNKVSNPPMLAHRISWEIYNKRTVPSGMFVCHKCDTPSCANPLHLFIGTASDNQRDRMIKGRLFTSPAWHMRANPK